MIIGFLALSGSAYADGDRELAERVGAVVGIGQSGACSSCHALNSLRTIEKWQVNALRVKTCLDEEQYPLPQERINCIAGSESSEGLDLSASRLGFYSAGLHLPEFQDLLRSVYGPEKTASINADLQSSTMMPLHGEPLSAEEFSDLSAWLEAGMPYLDELLTPDPGPSTCEESISPEFKDHLLRTERDGWQSRNIEAGMRMFACGSKGCFQQLRDEEAVFPEVSGQESSRGWKVDAATQMHILHEMGDETQYWIRSSADGRFVAYGGSPSGVIDLQSKLTDKGTTRVIPVEAFYDPAFFPDDSAFMFQGRRTGICQMSLLKDARTSHINFREDACSADDKSDIPLYQSIGASLDGSDYLAVTGYFESDSGDGNSVFDRDDEGELFGVNDSRLSLHPILYDGQRWVRRDAQVFETPWEIDWGMAPSNRLIIGRRQGTVGNQIRHLGYSIYQLSRPSSAEAYEKKALGTICVDGLKGNISFDDRFFVTYAYIRAEHYRDLGFESPDDPAFRELLEAGSANLFLYDFLTQKTKILTHMGPNQFALFPHFRSDGWIYFMVYDANGNKRKRLILASDAAVQAKAAEPTLP